MHVYSEVSSIVSNRTYSLVSVFRTAALQCNRPHVCSELSSIEFNGTCSQVSGYRIASLNSPFLIYLQILLLTSNWLHLANWTYFSCLIIYWCVSRYLIVICAAPNVFYDSFSEIDFCLWLFLGYCKPLRDFPWNMKQYINCPHNNNHQMIPCIRHASVSLPLPENINVFQCFLFPSSSFLVLVSAEGFGQMRDLASNSGLSHLTEPGGLSLVRRWKVERGRCMMNRETFANLV